MIVADVKTAFSHAKANKLIYVKLPAEDVTPVDETMCGRLNYSMYGTRDTGVNWAEGYSGRLIHMGVRQGNATPRALFLKERGLLAYGHGGDFVLVGPFKELKWMRYQLEQKYEFTVEALGPDDGRNKEVRVLNHILRWN